MTPNFTISIVFDLFEFCLNPQLSDCLFGVFVQAVAVLTASTDYFEIHS